MKKFLLSTVLLLTASFANVSASDTLIVVNAETNVPLRNVKIYIDHNTAVTTNIEGRFLLNHRKFKYLHLRSNGYLERIMTPEEIKGDTIYLLPSGVSLTEIVVNGVYKPRQIHIFTKEEMQLFAAGAGQGGIDLLSIGKAFKKGWAKIAGKKTDEEKRAAKMKNINDY